jgi:hypothetical protein
MSRDVRSCTGTRWLRPRNNLKIKLMATTAPPSSTRIWTRIQGSFGSAKKVDKLVMSNQRFFKIVCFRFPTNVPKKIEYFRFLIKILYRTKTFSFRSQNFLSKSNRFFQFPNFFETSKSSVLVSEIYELNQNVLVLFQNFWIK